MTSSNTAQLETQPIPAVRIAQLPNSEWAVAGESRRLRVLHVFDRLDVGGTEKTVLKLIRGLNPERFDHYICTLRGSRPEAETWTAGVTVVDAGRPGAQLQFNVPRLVGTMRRLRPDVVHSRNWGGIEAVIAARLAGVPFVIHSEHGYELEDSLGIPFHRRLFRNISYHCADRVVTVSSELRDYHARQAWWSPERIQVLRNGVNTQAFRQQPVLRREVRGRLHIPTDAFVVGSVGRLIKLKDYDTLLLAAARLIPEFPHLYVLLVGHGPEMTHLQELARQTPKLRGRVLLPGVVANPAEMLNAMDVFVLPSLVEGMSNTLLEAMATAVPVVASRTGGNPEVIGDSRCGCLFSPGDASGLVDQLRKLVTEPDLRLAYALFGQKRAAEQFGLQRMLDQYDTLYRQGAVKRRLRRT